MNNTMWKFLQPPAHKPEIAADRVDETYKWTRLQVFIGIAIEKFLRTM